MRQHFEEYGNNQAAGNWCAFVYTETAGMFVYTETAGMFVYTETAGMFVYTETAGMLRPNKG